MTHEKTWTSTLNTPAGPFTVIIDSADAILASGFTSTSEELLPLIHRSLRPIAPPAPMPDLGEISRVISQYFDGNYTIVETLPVRQHTNGEFHRTAWDALRMITPGRLLSYGQLAALAGRPAAVRAAAQACARNTAAVIIPCHRVIRHNGTLGGYRWGLGVKQWLINIEQRAAPMTEQK